MSGSRSERRWWLAVVGLVVLIYSTLYVVRVPVEFLRDLGLLRLTVASAFAGFALAGLVWFRRRSFGRLEGLVFAGFGAVFAAAVLLAKMPEEKLHFLQYGLLGFLLHHACRERAARLGRGELGATLTGIVLAGAIGWGDEGIQALLPNRYYDPRDIVWNLLGSSIVILALAAAAAVRGRDARA